MPIYEYACDQCGHHFDTRQSWSDDSLTVCPECTGHIRRVLHPAGVIFKGSGWYVTDNRKSPNGAPKSAAKSDSSDSETTKSEPAKPKAESSAAADA